MWSGVRRRRRLAAQHPGDARGCRVDHGTFRGFLCDGKWFFCLLVLRNAVVCGGTYWEEMKLKRIVNKLKLLHIVLHIYWYYQPLLCLDLHKIYTCHKKVNSSKESKEF